VFAGRRGQLQSPLDVVHLPRDPAQVLVLPAHHVEEHQAGDHLVALRRIDHVVEQADDRFGSFFFQQQRVLGHCPVEQVGRWIDDLFRLDGFQSLQRFFMDSAVRQGLGVGQGEVAAIKGVGLGVLDGGGQGRRRGGGRVAGLGQELAGRVVAQGQGVGHAVKHGGVTVQIASNCFKPAASALPVSLSQPSASPRTASALGDCKRPKEGVDFPGVSANRLPMPKPGRRWRASWLAGRTES